MAPPRGKIHAAATPISVWTGLIEGVQTIHLVDLHLDHCGGSDPGSRSDPGSTQGICFRKRLQAVFLGIWESWIDRSMRQWVSGEYFCQFICPPVYGHSHSS
jgi:hypothetical protein